MLSEWRGIPGFSCYEVSEFGHIRRSLSTPTTGKVGYRKRPGALLKAEKTKQGYNRFFLLADNGRLKKIFVHRVVALAFIGPCPSEKHLALHWDDNPRNNHYSNIRWGTTKDNYKDAVRNGKSVLICGVDARGEKNAAARLTNKKVLQARRLFFSGKEKLTTLAQEAGVALSTMSKAINGKNWGWLK